MVEITEDGIICVGSFEDWYGKRNDLRLLDIRSDQEYAKCHVIGSVHIPLSSLKHRSYELPPRQDAFAVLVPATCNEKQEAIQLIREFFLCQDETDNHTSRDPPRRRRSQKPWKVRLVLLAEDDANWKQAKKLGCLKETLDEINPTTSSSSTFRPLPRLWQPDSMVKDILLPLLAERVALSPYSLKDGHRANFLHEVWDLGAGAGRDVAFLAEELKAATGANACAYNGSITPRFCVVAMDQRFRSIVASEASPSENVQQEECLLFWKRRGVEDVTRCVSIHWGGANQNEEYSNWFQRETSQPRYCISSEGQELAPQRHVLCIYMVRFWNQTLMDFLAKSTLVKEGTLLAISQFAKPHPGASWNFEHPKEKNVLERNELSDMFSSDTGWSVLHDKIVPDSDHGRTLIQFVSVKM